MLLFVTCYSPRFSLPLVSLCCRKREGNDELLAVDERDGQRVMTLQDPGASSYVNRVPQDCYDGERDCCMKEKPFSLELSAACPVRVCCVLMMHRPPDPLPYL